MAGDRTADATGSQEREGIAPGSVVVGVDGSRGSQLALAWANEHADRTGPIVTVTCRHHALRSSAAVELLQAAQAAKMLVVGSRGRNTVVGSLFGSTSVDCAHHSSIPVAIVPGGIDPSAPVDHIAVGVDGSENSLEALRWALRFAPDGAVVDVYFSWMSLPIASSLTARELDRVRASSENFLCVIVDRLISEEQAEHRSIRRHLSIGDPAEVLLAAEPSMVVVGSRSNGSLVSALLSSPADSLASTSRTVAVFVRAPSHSTAEEEEQLP